MVLKRKKVPFHVAIPYFIQNAIASSFEKEKKSWSFWRSKDVW
jgi:hypothetical protein